MTHSYLAVYGHFYQPPREDPFTGRIPREAEAAPYHDFNEKIHAECYRPNAQAGNFERISFNLGPTLATWLESAYPDTYTQIIAADRAHYRRFGYGNALAQAYNHTILPLATMHEKRTQISWGLQDFRRRFGHEAEGMWLPETAVDLETLGLLAEQGVRYTVLAPWQADLPEGQLDPTEPYLVRLPDGRSITVFFYQSILSGAVSFNEDMTSDATRFTADCLPHYLNQDKLARDEAQLVLIATDGELYGHHKPFRDMFLTHLLGVDAQQYGFEPVSLSRYLHLYPPTREVAIRENTSWSCHHGVARWATGCTCTDGDSSWKGPLRAALTDLAHAADTLIVERASLLLGQPWTAIDQSVLLQEGVLSNRAFWGVHARAAIRLSAEDIALLDSLAVAYAARQAMMTSCGFFFEDIDRIEPRIVLANARKVLVLVEEATGAALDEPFLAKLALSVVSGRAVAHLISSPRLLNASWRRRDRQVRKTWHASCFYPAQGPSQEAGS